MICLNFEDDNAKNFEGLKSLRKNLPQVSINEEGFYIAKSTKNEERLEYENGFWEIKSKAQKLF